MSGRSRDNSASQVNLHDVARLAGVGIATASRTISGRGAVSPATREKVLDAVAKLGYRPNPLARSMRSDRSRIVAFMLPDLINEFYTVSADVIHRDLSAAGYQMIITSASSSDEEWQTFQWLGDYRVDGIIHVPIGPTLPLPQDVPIVQINRISHQRPMAAVLADDKGGFDQLTTLLLERGHTDLAVITGEEWHSSTRYRLAGVRDAVDRKKNVRFRVKPGQFTRAWGYEATLLMADDLPQAIIASSPRIASGVIQALQELEVNVPNEVSLVSYDDPEWFSLWQPGMTSVVPPLAEMSHRAVERLIGMIERENEDNGGVEHLPCEIRERGSIAQR